MPAIIIFGFSIALMSGLSQIPQLVTGKVPNFDLRVGTYLIMRYDMAGILFHAPRADASLIKAAGFDHDRLMQVVKETYTGERTDYYDRRLEETYDLNVIYTTGVNGGVPAFDDYFRHMKEIWVDLVIHQPKAYLAHRLESFAWLLGLRDESKCIPVFVGVPDGMGISAALGLNPPPTSRDSYVYGLFTSLRDTIFYQHWVYLAWTLALLAFVGLTYRPGDEAILGLGLSALVMTFSFLVLGLACDFRYLYMPMVVSLVMPVMIAGRRARPAAPASS
jgi:hypothetical protein